VRGIPLQAEESAARKAKQSKAEQCEQAGKQASIALDQHKETNIQQ
jgi:hypothetical protein